jgi:hypothetical protein
LNPPFSLSISACIRLAPSRAFAVEAGARSVINLIGFSGVFAIWSSRPYAAKAGYPNSFAFSARNCANRSTIARVSFSPA